MDSDFLWHSIGGGAIIAAALTLARLLLDYGFRGGERRAERDERRQARERDAEARLERILQDRLAESDRRLERCDGELRAERVRSAGLEQDLRRLQQAHELLELEYAALLGRCLPVAEVVVHDARDAGDRIG
jgi:C4-dicarboxylate-specific signal transduction histidine kinase